MAEKRKPRGLGRGLGALIPDTRELPGFSSPEQAEISADQSSPAAVIADEPAKPAVEGAAGPKSNKAKAAGVSSDSRATQEGPEGAVEDSSPDGTSGKPASVSQKKTRSRSNRPVDFFFQPSSSGEEGEKSSSGIDLDRLRVSKSKPSTRKKTQYALDTSDPEDAVSTEPEEGQDARSVSDVPRETAFSSEEQDGLIPVEGARFAEIPLDSIRPNSKQPRSVFEEEAMDELVQSIQQIGVLQPIVVRPDSTGEAQYELVMGERRWRASRLAGRETVPAIIKGTQDMDLLRDALLENLHRSQLNPLEEAAAYQQLLEEFGCTQEELSKRIGRSRPQISNTIRLLKLPNIVQLKVAAGTITSGHARALLALDDQAASVELAQRIINEGLSVRSTEELVSQASGEKKTSRRNLAPSPRHERLDTIATSLADRLDTSVKISLGAKKGKMTIEFASVEDLNRIVDLLGGQ